MIFGIKRSLFLILLTLLLMVGVTFSVIIVSTLRSLKPEPTTVSPLEQGSQVTDTPSTAGSSPTPARTSTPTLISSETAEATANGTEPPAISTPTTALTVTPTASYTATNTVTATPDIDACALISLNFVKATSTIGLWRLRNNSAAPLYLTRIALEWPKENDAIFNAVLSDEVIWAGEDLITPTLITSWLGAPIHQEVRGTVSLEFGFGTDAATSGYNLELNFDNGCSVAAAN